ncbi:MAG TPA: thiamine-phosphate kinase, partial [Microbacterium sp.]|nr:thiamine-phosphate kinase [Microbacterium sp.]
LAGGEDHALLAAFPPGVVPSGFRVIGEARQAGDEALLCDEAPVDVSGWDPYRDWDSAAG